VFLNDAKRHVFQDLLNKRVMRPTKMHKGHGDVRRVPHDRLHQHDISARVHASWVVMGRSGQLEILDEQGFPTYDESQFDSATSPKAVKFLHASRLGLAENTNDDGAGSRLMSDFKDASAGGGTYMDPPHLSSGGGGGGGGVFMDPQHRPWAGSGYASMGPKHFSAGGGGAYMDPPHRSLGGGGGGGGVCMERPHCSWGGSSSDTNMDPPRPSSSGGGAHRGASMDLSRFSLGDSPRYDEGQLDSVTSKYTTEEKALKKAQKVLRKLERRKEIG
jgi:hypothetical protein